jgi:quercetin dioxygenase-like cupin family protein
LKEQISCTKGGFDMAYDLYPDWKERVAFLEEGPRPEVLEENNRLKVILAGLEPGQKIPEHPENLGMYYFLEGNGWMIIDGERVAVSQGATVITPQGAVRGMEAETRLAFIAARVT